MPPGLFGNSRNGSDLRHFPRHSFLDWPVRVAGGRSVVQSVLGFFMANSYGDQRLIWLLQGSSQLFSRRESCL